VELNFYDINMFTGTGSQKIGSERAKVQKGRGLGSRDPISKFWDPLITFERIELSASNLAHT